MLASFAAAFNAGSRFADEDGRIIEVRTQVVGELKVKTGRLYAADTLVGTFGSTAEPHGAPLDRHVPVGVFPVEVALASFESGEQRVACARVRFASSDRVAVRWEPARSEGQPDPPEGESWGYGVDSGTGCFFDGAAVGVVDDETSEAWLAALEKTYVPTWAWHVADVGPANVVMFSSGWGDGVFTSYWGLDAKDGLVELVTDFEVLVPAESDRLEILQPLPRGRFESSLLDKYGVTMRVPWLSFGGVVVLGGNSASTVELTDGTPIEMIWKGDERHYTWKPSSPDAKLVVSMRTGATLLDDSS